MELRIAQLLLNNSSFRKMANHFTQRNCDQPHIHATRVRRRAFLDECHDRGICLPKTVALAEAIEAILPTPMTGYGGKSFSFR
jgi:hypothetical protein